MELVPNDNDWVCFLDADTMFLTPDYGHQIHRIVKKYPNTGMFTCVTNRVGNPCQRYNGEMSKNSDIIYHRQLALDLQKKHKYHVQELFCRVAGYFMLLKKETWKQVKFPDGLLGVDYEFSNELYYHGFNIMLMKGVYLFHYYRLIEGVTYKAHLE
jgi:GT2 family glycosyltransferase